ncbi:50S ribosomal protein L11 methyltransferase [Clostridium taeniosporum]|uniref:50S ribosomal protein L11 methyltransferase n=1 Tax=Clostridium taeniosporum TaxID=394958 RepID=A0A1D7XIL8_9CLOT|nr:50S ribosomal protein L11 methyltransferase [Clostridium taeniosporum]AOR23030.1 50S ribosomal protein L11 methyltransferase [Clostridium taeniosporum]
MFIITYKIPYENIDISIEKLQFNDIFNVFYESPLEITTDEFGYGYIEKDDVIIDFKVAFDGKESDLEEFTNKVNSIFQLTPDNTMEENYNYEETHFPAIHIDDKWVIASPEEDFPGKQKINFISQGAFGTGMHETTQNILKYILSKDFTNLDVLDIGTGSGILSLATSIKNARRICALDIRDVHEEIAFNSSLNEITNIETFVGNALNNEVVIDGTFDWIYINIGGEETEMFIDYINDHIKENGKLLVSGLVEWSFDSVKEKIESKGYIMEEKIQTNEWCTAIFNRK